MAAVVEHSDKYDRQLRLWGERGQRLLESAKVVLLGASAVGTETLKNLVLPGPLPSFPATLSSLLSLAFTLVA